MLHLTGFPNAVKFAGTVKASPQLVDPADYFAQQKEAIIYRALSGDDDTHAVVHALLHRTIEYQLGGCSLPSARYKTCPLHNTKLKGARILPNTWGHSTVQHLQEGDKNLRYYNFPPTSQPGIITYHPLLDEIDAAIDSIGMELDETQTFNTLRNFIDSSGTHYVEELFPHPTTLQDDQTLRLYLPHFKLLLTPVVYKFIERMVFKYEHSPDVMHGVITLRQDMFTQTHGSTEFAHIVDRITDMSPNVKIHSTKWDAPTAPRPRTLKKTRAKTASKQKSPVETVAEQRDRLLRTLYPTEHPHTNTETHDYTARGSFYGTHFICNGLATTEYKQARPLYAVALPQLIYFPNFSTPDKSPSPLTCCFTTTLLCSPNGNLGATIRNP
jgi:hypothetical protein